jgi:RHS repeat-associated protein
MYSSTAYAPFGEPYAQAGTADLSFTGQNQDTVGGLYDFFFREYSTQGRWPSPDPAGLAAVDLSDPSRWIATLTFVMTRWIWSILWGYRTRGWV